MNDWFRGMETWLAKGILLLSVHMEQGGITTPLNSSISFYFALHLRRTAAEGNARITVSCLASGTVETESGNPRRAFGPHSCPPDHQYLLRSERCQPANTSGARESRRQQVRCPNQLIRRISIRFDSLVFRGRKSAFTQHIACPFHSAGLSCPSLPPSSRYAVQPAVIQSPSSSPPCW